MDKKRTFSNKDTVQITIRLPEATMKQVKEEAIKTNRNLNQMIISLVQKGLEGLANQQPSPKN